MSNALLAVTTVVAVIITFWTGTIYSIYEMAATHLEAQIFILSVVAIFGVLFYNVAKGRSPVA